MPRRGKRFISSNEWVWLLKVSLRYYLLCRQGQQFLYQRRQSAQIVEGLLPNVSSILTCRAICSEIENVGQALQRVVDLVCEAVCHVGGGGSSLLLHQQCLLALVANSH